MKTIFVKPEQANRAWFVIDAKGKPLGRVAAKAASLARGKEKPNFTPHWETGDFVIVINAAEVEITGRKRTEKMYYRHTGYPGGLKSTTFDKLIERHGCEPMALAVRGMLPKGPLGRKILKNVKIYPGSDHPHAAQSPSAIGIE